LRIDGGMVANDWLAQDLADILDLPVERPGFVETTALGAAMLAAVGVGMHENLEVAAAAMDSEVTQFTSRMAPAERDQRLDGWSQAISLVRHS
jgi:glycerol kinase